MRVYFWGKQVCRIFAAERKPTMVGRLHSFPRTSEEKTIASSPFIFYGFRYLFLSANTLRFVTFVKENIEDKGTIIAAMPHCVYRINESRLSLSHTVWITLTRLSLPHPAELFPGTHSQLTSYFLYVLLFHKDNPPDTVCALFAVPRFVQQRLGWTLWWQLERIGLDVC